MITTDTYSCAIPEPRLIPTASLSTTVEVATGTALVDMGLILPVVVRLVVRTEIKFRQHINQ